MCLLSGRLRTGSEYYVFGPRREHQVTNNKNNNYDEGIDIASPPSRSIRLYLLMGSSFVHVSEVPAGHLCAIYGLEDVHLKRPPCPIMFIVNHWSDLKIYSG